MTRRVGRFRPARPWVALGVIALLSTGCGEPPVLEVGTVEFGEQDIGALGQSQQNDLLNLTAFGLAVAEGRTREVRQPFVERDLRSIVLQRLAMEMAVSDAGLSRAELEAAYHRDPAHELVVRHLVVVSERWRPQTHRDSARALAQEALRRARAGEPFPELAGEYSDEPGAAERGGLLEPGREGSWVPEFWSAASSLEEGELSGVVETEYGFHVIRLEDRRVVPFEDMRDQVVERVVNLPRALGRAGEWAAARTQNAVIDTARILEWAGGRATSGPLVRWPERTGGSPFTVADLESYLSTLDPAALPGGQEGSPAEIVEFVASVARNELMLEHAQDLGIRPSQAQRAAIEQRWRERIGRWAQALGFEEGAPEEAVRAGALDAVGSRQQAAIVARSELRDLAPVLRGLYPIERVGSSSETG